MLVKASNFLATLALLLTSLPARGKHLDETCNEGGQLTIMYWQHCPYIMSLPSGQVSGIFPNLLGSIVKQCCHSDVHMVYQQTKGSSDFYAAIKRVRMTKESVEEQSSQPQFDIALPLHTSKYGKSLFETLPFIAVAESLGIAVLKHSNVSSAKLMMSLVQAWPVLLFIILAACIAGVMMWFVERHSNSKQFSASFFSGAFDGFWWAFISMTSVGYGDKYPKSVIGKLLGACWIVTGMLFVTMFLGILTSTLMTLLMEGTFDIQHKKITVVDRSEAHWLGIEHHATIKVVKKQKDLYLPLIEYKVDAALVDINSLQDVIQNLQKEHNIRVSGVLLKEIFYGIVLREQAKNLTSCFQEYLEKHEQQIIRKMSEHIGTQKEKPGPAEDYFGSGGIFSISVYCMIAVLVTFCVCGAIWELHKMRNLALMNEERNVDEYSGQDSSKSGRLALGTISTSIEAFPSDCQCNMKDPFESVDLYSRQSDV
ncbi:uncharacterized protein LOC114539445 [Dendronephthya gigantea]|uniref:uncharacterized protein LOC114539445 n=1 Tax=Dendronephthya gigantea TaxID=151771 RepID=UPI00106CF839|nr:uncharacterized protein LOC114539445 [Dendronephthya gigantea]XP_028415874.1 uncharacterized protein LOC114539445 [Dendronephthya gigantea]XP_028415875.1 uncharacterized protein LOC114539445 [Dendronephthya gigantea]